MLTRTLPNPEIEQESPKEEAIKSVQDKGFALYEWISPEELRMTLERDYLQIVRWASIPLAVISAIAGFIGFAGGPIGTVLAVLAVLGVFYFFVGLILSIKFFYHSYLYTRGANVVITDNHYVSGGNIIEHTDREAIRNGFSKYESIFDEPFMGESRLEEKKKIAKTQLFDNLKDIAGGGGKLLQNVGRSRDSGGLVIAILIAGFLYATMMGLVYFIGIFFISLFGRVFAWLAHRYLLATSNTEHRIQSLFREIDESAKLLESEKSTTINLLDAATQNEWKENLMGKINESTELLGKLAGTATDDSRKLRSILESSKYKNIFNFVKYGNWVKKQILEPIESILLLLKKNHDTIEKTLSSLDTQITTTTDPSLQKPLILQKDRLTIQLESFERVMKMLEGYKQKLS
ncbi:hypothetical protein KBD33_04170 [Candidatus Gracilibacteria bacterium]|nr:hypothetical protein [Candidatus Gracilibacteria bacterium]